MADTEKTKKPHVNNLATRPLDYCCGGVELGNFNYVDPPDGKKMSHYHKVSSTWKSRPNEQDDPTTMADLKEKLQYVHSSLVMATTGAGQEYVEPLLQELGFQHVFTFVNLDHADTPVKLWARAKKPYVAPSVADKKAGE